MIPDHIKVILGFLVWTLAIHVVEENLTAFYLILGIAVNYYMAYYWVVFSRPRPDIILSERVFKLYLFHIVLAKICFFWYLYLSLDGIRRTVIIWEDGLFNDRYQSNYNSSRMTY